MLIQLEDGRTVGIENSKGDITYISHAHSDHARKGRIFSSKETFDLLHNNFSEEVSEHDSHSSADFIPISDKSIELHPAGHILGSTQIRFTNSHTVVFTGDMKLRNSFTSQKARILDCDELHIDCTFGHQDFVFPDIDVIADRIDRWTRTRLMTGQNVIFGAYSTGKAQELIKILNDYSNITPIVDNTIEQKCKVYEKHGVRLERAEIGSEKANEIMKGKFVYVVPFHLVNRDSENWFRIQYKQASFALVTGWALRYKYKYTAFPLSDHAGFSEIIEYIDSARPKEIICHYGNAAWMASYLKSKGYNAKTESEWRLYSKNLITESVKDDSILRDNNSGLNAVMQSITQTR